MVGITVRHGPVVMHGLSVTQAAQLTQLLATPGGGQGVTDNAMLQSIVQTSLSVQQALSARLGTHVPSLRDAILHCSSICQPHILPALRAA